ncbi:hypothetical protein J3D43_003965 [Paenibacillus xylanexedens]|uniref:hypothetical protein n=1 Tax=Paenibacillus xylanexedens TaxID=528191 RepID=UPI0020A02C56|nr:hypothetical protein [Paenibacillus xylanexedens]MCP1425449.1 hypothetical protein [Paenibacillus xylanexedens]
MAEFGLNIVQRFLETKGLKADKIDERDEKTPDFEVFEEEHKVFYCEEKTLDYDDFEGEKDDSTYNAISRHLHKAVKQFKSVNPNHEIPNILAIVNRDPLKNVHDLFIALTGQAPLDSGEYMKIHRVGHRTVEDINEVDLYLWFDNEKFVNLIWKDVENAGMRQSLERYFVSQAE